MRPTVSTSPETIPADTFSKMKHFHHPMPESNRYKTSDEQIEQGHQLR